MSNRIGDNLIHYGPNRELVQALSDARASFVVVGGLAISWHCAARQADDLDILLEPTAENSVRAASALQKLGLAGFDAESFARLGLQVPLKATHYADLLTPQDAVISFAETADTAVNAKLFGIPVRLASAASLIKMKKHAATSAGDQREKHLNDIALLENAAGVA